MLAPYREIWTPYVAPEMSAYLRVEGLRVELGRNVAIADLSLDVAKGEFLTLLGPSGCGKTTTLRAIAGFVEPARGRITVGGADLTKVPAHRRNIGMVFQSYALFPHLTVLENVAFGLRMRHVKRRERLQRAQAALELVGLASLTDRYPAQLSGGQQQRVALARALVIQPSILLLDEPLSNLDARLRVELRHEIRQLQSRFGITTILVTHDQEEAIAVSDRIAVLNDGRMVDIGTPQEMCDRPAHPFAASFIGGRTVISGVTRMGVFEAPGIVCTGAPERATALVLRARRLRLNGSPGQLSATGRIVRRTYLRDEFEADVETASGILHVILSSDTPPPNIGEDCTVTAQPGGVSFLVDERPVLEIA